MNAGIVVLMAAFGAPGPDFVRGIVTGPDGAPVEQSQVLLIRQDDDDRKPLAVISGDDGWFTIEPPEDFPIGTDANYLLFAHRTGVGTGVAWFHASELPLRSVPLRLQACVPGTLRLLDPNGNPLRGGKLSAGAFVVPGTNIFAGLPSTEVALLTRSTDAAGVAAFDFFPERCQVGTFRIETAPFGVQDFVISGTAGQQPVRLQPIGRVLGELRLDDPAAAAGAWCLLRSTVRQTDRSRANPGGRARVQVDQRGRFEVPALAAGEVTLYGVEFAAGSRFFLEKPVTVALTAGGTVRMPVPLVRGVRVHGRVIDEETSLPVAGATVVISPHQRTFGDLVTTRQTDDQGRYEAFLAPAENLQALLRLAKLPYPYFSGSALPQTVSSTARELDVPQFVVRQGVLLRGRVVDQLDQPVPYARVQGVWQAPPAAGTTPFAPRISRHAADVLGRFSIGPVPRDAQVILTAEDDTRGSTETTVVDLTTQLHLGIRLTVAPIGMLSISGRIVDQGGGPVAGAEVGLTAEVAAPSGKTIQAGPIPFPGHPNVVTDAAGCFAFPVPLPRLANYSIRSRPADHGAIVVRVPTPHLSETAVAIPDIVATRAEGR